MTKRIRSKRVVAVIIVLVIALSLSSQAYAAPWGTADDTTQGGGRPNNSFSGMSGTMNALGGGVSSRWSISSGILPANSTVTGVSVTLRVSSGSARCELYIASPQNPAGVYIGTYGVGTNYINTSVFNGQNPSGTWYVWIRTTGTVSTATANMTVNYFYP